jgi:small-conductance mechanosensitive channel
VITPTNPTRHVVSTIDWIGANLHGLAIGSLVAAGIVAVMMLIRVGGRWLLQGDPHCTHWRGVIGRVLSRTTILFMVATAIDIVASYTAIPPRLERLADIAFTIAAALQAAIWARELILGAIARKVGEEPGETTLGNASAIIRVLASVILFALAIVVILDNLGVNVTGLVAGLGIGGIAIGLAAQGIFSDLFAALSIVFDRPFRRGDTIKFGTTTGTVERIGLKTTRIRAVGGEQVIMANTKLLEQEVSNIAAAKVRRIVVGFTVAYSTDPKILEALGDEAAEIVEPLKNVRLVRCQLVNFCPSAIECELIYDHRTTSNDELALVRSKVMLGVTQLFRRKKIAFGFPVQVGFSAGPDGRLVPPFAPAKPADSRLP